MSRYIQGEDNHQVSLFPMSLDVMIPDDHSVRVIDLFVDTLDIIKLGFAHGETKATGRKPFDPRHLLKLYLYGYLNGIRSSRKLEKEAYRNIEVMWLLDQLKPDDRTISNFRQHNPDALQQVFKEFSFVCNDFGLYGKEIIAVDGSKFRANNARKKSYTKGKVQKMLEHHEASAKKYMALLESEDQNEDAGEELSKTELKERLEQAKKRIRELQEIAEEVEKNGEISITDPDAKHMNASNNGTDIAYNVQIAGDEKHHLVVAVDTTNSPADHGQLHNMATKATEAFEEMDSKTNQANNTNETELNDSKEESEKEPLSVVADKGYYSGEELGKCKTDGMNLIVSKQKPPSKKGKEAYNKTHFVYDQDADEYICPMGERLKNASRKETKKKRYTNPKACNKCTARDACTTSKSGRSIFRGPYQDLYDEVDQYTQEHMDLYKLRQQIIEHPFGTIKRTLGFTYFLTRGMESVKGETSMHFLTYNLKRVLNIVDRMELIEYLKAKKHTLFRFFKKNVIWMVKKDLIFMFS